MNIEGAFDNAHNKPWSKRAALSPRRTYSAESSIVYKRKKHYFDMRDLERVSKVVEARVREPAEENGMLMQFMGFLKRATVSMMEILMGPRFSGAADTAYEFFHDTLEAVIDNKVSDPDVREKLRQSAQAMLDDLLTFTSQR